MYGWLIKPWSRAVGWCDLSSSQRPCLQGHGQGSDAELTGAGDGGGPAHVRVWSPKAWSGSWSWPSHGQLTPVVIRELRPCIQGPFSLARQSVILSGQALSGLGWTVWASWSCLPRVPPVAFLISSWIRASPLCLHACCLSTHRERKLCSNHSFKLKGGL
jgi:hypothetical protein